MRCRATAAGPPVGWHGMAGRTPDAATVPMSITTERCSGGAVGLQPRSPGRPARPTGLHMGTCRRFRSGQHVHVGACWFTHVYARCM